MSRWRDEPQPRQAEGPRQDPPHLHARAGPGRARSQLRRGEPGPPRRPGADRGHPLPRVQEAGLRPRVPGGGEGPGVRGPRPQPGLQGGGGQDARGQRASRPSPAGCAPRRTSARAPASWGRSSSPWPSATSSASSPTGRRSPARWGCLREPPPPARRWRAWAAAPPALTAAGDLVQKGHDVTVFEALHEIGGVLVYGIPEFRLPKDIVRRDVDNMRKMGVTFETNVVVGKTVTIDELMNEEGFDAVFVGHRGRPPPLPQHPRREPQRRLLRQRVPLPGEPHEGLPLPRVRPAHLRLPGQDGGGHRRRQHRPRLDPHRPPPRGEEDLHDLPPLGEGDAGARRGDPPRPGRGGRDPDPHPPGGVPRGREGLAQGRPLHPDGARRARRLRAAAARSRSRARTSRSPSTW